MQQDLDQIYDTFAADYDKNRGLFDLSKILDGFFERLGHPHGRMLDLGCGAGEPCVRYFIDRNWDTTGVDFSVQMLQLARQYVPQMTQVHGDMRAVEFAPGSFNAVTAIYSLFHVPHIEHGALFRKIHTWLEPGGLFLFTYATQHYTGSEEFSGYKEFMGRRLYYSHKNTANLARELTETGFTLESNEHHTIGGETFLWITVRKQHRPIA